MTLAPQAVSAGRRAFAGYGNFADRARQGTHAIAPLWYPIAVTFIVAVAMVFPDQAIDALRILAEDRRPSRIAALALATIAFATASWAWARGLVYTLRPLREGEPQATVWSLASLVQTSLGMAPFLILAIALIRASTHTVDNTAAIFARYMATASIVLAFVTLAISSRANFVRRRSGKKVDLSAVTSLPPLTWFATVVSFLMWVIGLFWAREHGALDAAQLGPMTVILLAATAWVAIGSVLVWLGALIRFPLAIVPLFMMVCSGGFDLNDNHAARSVSPRMLPGDTADFTNTFAGWLRSRADLQQYQRDPDGYPVFLVAAEGGGLRAAYYSAQVLATIQDACPAFARHVLAISGVSGGSLGSAVFASLAKQWAANDTNSTCGAWRTTFRPGTDSILSQDFLSPVLAAFLFPDLLNRFLPWAIESADRARPLEMGWERAVNRVVGADSTFARSFSDLWGASFTTTATPGLLLNITHVETGRQYVASNFGRFGTRARGLMALPASMMDSMPLSTAVSISARFPVVSPAASVRLDGEKTRFVDGGYFENSGVATLLDLISLLPDRDPISGVRVRPVVIQVVSVDSAVVRDAVRLTANSFGELMSPVRTLLNTRHARGETSTWQLLSASDPPQCPRNSRAARVQHVRFVLRDASGLVPLGWQLSRQSRAYMREQIDTATRSPAKGPCGPLAQVIASMQPARQR